MARARRIRFIGTAEGHRAAEAALAEPGDAVIDLRGVERALVMLCPDGCGDVLTINLDKRSGKAWRTDRRHGGLTVYPSVWRDSGCGAHFIVWRDQILWCDWWESPDPADVRLTARVMQEIALHGAEYVHYEVVATAIDENPWDVHWACNVLTRRGDVEVRERVSYRKRTPRPAGIERSA